MTTEYTFKVMLATDGGMTQSNDGREVYMTDNDMATEIGNWILASIKNACVDDAEVTVIIKTEEQI